MINMSTYARALFEVAQEQNSALKFYDSLKHFSVINKDPEIASVLNRRLGDDKILKPFWDTTGFSKEVVTLLNMLQNAGLMREYDRFLSAYQDLCVSNNLLSVATVTSAKPLSESERESLFSMLSNKYPGELELELSEDQSLIKGLRIEINHDVIDTSLKNKLKQILNQGGQH